MENEVNEDQYESHWNGLRVSNTKLKRRTVLDFISKLRGRGSSRARRMELNFHYKIENLMRVL